MVFSPQGTIVTSDELEDGSVTTAKLADGAVTSAKRGWSGVNEIRTATQVSGSTTVTQDVVGVATDDGAFTLTLDSDFGQGAVVVIWDVDGNAGTNPITIQDEDGNTIDDAASIPIDMDGAGVVLRKTTVGGTTLWRSSQVSLFTEIANQDYSEARSQQTVQTSATESLDLSVANVFEVTMENDTTFSFDNADSSPPVNSFAVITIQDATGGRTITWPASVEWGGGSKPSETTDANAKDWYGFITVDGGTTWLGVQSAANLS